MNGGQVCGVMVQAFQTNGSKAGHFLPFSPASCRLYQFSLAESLITSLVEQSQS